MNGWDTAAFPLADGDSDGIYTGTYALEAGTINFKYFASGPLGWEQDPDRTYEVTTEPSQTIPVSGFNGICGSEEDYEIVFSVDMNVAIQRGAFDPDEQEVYVAGNLNGWDSSGNPDYQLLESSTFDNVYTGVIEATGLATPSSQPPVSTSSKVTSLKKRCGTTTSWKPLPSPSTSLPVISKKRSGPLSQPTVPSEVRRVMNL